MSHLNVDTRISCGSMNATPTQFIITFSSTDKKQMEDIRELVFLYHNYAMEPDENLTEDAKEVKAAIWKLLRPWEYEEQEK